MWDTFSFYYIIFQENRGIERERQRKKERERREGDKGVRAKKGTKTTLGENTPEVSAVFFTISLKKGLSDEKNVKYSKL